MIYALIDNRADDFFMCKIVWGDIHQVAEAVLQSCDWVFESLPNVNITDIENEYDCSLDAYKILKNIRPNLPVIRAFAMYVEDMEVNVAFAVDGYAAFYTAFQNYKTKREQFANMELTQIMDETEENLQQLNAEIRSISGGKAFVEEYRYLQKNEGYEEQEEKVYS